MRKFNMENVSPCPTPMITNKQFTTKGEKSPDPIMFKQAIGALQLKNGLYQLCDNKYSYVYMSLKESWHRKLGHPNNKVLEKVLKECNVKTSPSDSFMFCEACHFGESHGCCLHCQNTIHGLDLDKVKL